MKISMKTIGKIVPTEEIDLKLAQERLQSVARRRADSFARAMTTGLHEVADYVEQTKAVDDAVTESFASVKKDADHVQFAARGESHSQVGGRVLTSVEVGVVPLPTPSGRDPELVARAFEFGSVALDVPATAFSQEVEQQQEHAARNDMKGVAEVLE